LLALEGLSFEEEIEGAEPVQDLRCSEVLLRDLSIDVLNAGDRGGRVLKAVLDGEMRASTSTKEEATGAHKNIDHDCGAGVSTRLC
jgi:hypothetical protein